MNCLQDRLQQRFYRYLAIPSQSDAAAGTVPSTPGQLQLARLLAEELTAYGLSDIHIDEHGIVYARRPGDRPAAPSIGFVAHLDTVDVGLSPEIKPQVLTYQGEDLCLNRAADIWFRAEDHPEAIPYIGEPIIFSDGTSVLGADNKAAVTVIMELMQNLQTTEQDLGDIHVAFVPDEEIGLRGAKRMDLTRFAVDFAYTIDCCDLGEVVYETFNAGTAIVDIKGTPAHPMAAKNVLVNPVTLAHDFMASFNAAERPEHTEGREGFYYFSHLHAQPESARLTVAIRDHDRPRYEQRKRYIEAAVALLQQRHPGAGISCHIEDVYSNIGDALGQDNTALDLIFASLDELAITPRVIPMRGGTDGAALSARGLITPNYFTGALNFHSRFEFLPLSSFTQSYCVTRAICTRAGQL